MTQAAALLNLKMTDLPIGPGDHRRWSGLNGPGLALAIHESIELSPRTVLVVAESPQSAQRLQSELLFFSDGKYRVNVFPDYETLIYDGFSPHQDILSDRLALLSQDFR
ncbi:MAG: hypothetical protein ACPG4A_11690, partial [Pseudomonadales bacterium]